MEGSISSELYSDILKNANNGLPSCSNNELSDTNEGDEGDLWYDDGSADECAQDKSANTSDLDREWQRRRDQLHNVGYRDGLMAGKEASAQEGFNIGFKESVHVGINFGVVRGITSALAGLPSGLRENLIKTEEKRIKFRDLHESLHSVSTTDALKLFHDSLSSKHANNGNAETDNRSQDVDSQRIDKNVLDAYYEELRSLVESPAIKTEFWIAGDKPKEGEDEVKSSCPLHPGRHTYVMYKDYNDRCVRIVACLCVRGLPSYPPANVLLNVGSGIA